MILDHFGPPATPQSLQYQSSRRQLNVRILCFLITGGSGRPQITLNVFLRAAKQKLQVTLTQKYF